MTLFHRNYTWEHPIRSLGLRGADLVTADAPVQRELFDDPEKMQKLDAAVDDIRRRFGYFAVQRAFTYRDPQLMQLDARGDNVVHPISYLHAEM